MQSLTIGKAARLTEVGVETCAGSDQGNDGKSSGNWIK